MIKVPSFESPWWRAPSAFIAPSEQLGQFRTKALPGLRNKFMFSLLVSVGVKVAGIGFFLATLCPLLEQPIDRAL